MLRFIIALFRAIFGFFGFSAPRHEVKDLNVLDSDRDEVKDLNVLDSDREEVKDLNVLDSDREDIGESDGLPPGLLEEIRRAIEESARDFSALLKDLAGDCLVLRGRGEEIGLAGSPTLSLRGEVLFMSTGKTVPVDGVGAVVFLGAAPTLVAQIGSQVSLWGILLEKDGVFLDRAGKEFLLILSPDSQREVRRLTM